MEFLRKLLGTHRPNSSAINAKGPSAIDAKGRLISVLIHDRTDISPQLLENLRVEMIALLKKYMDIDESNIELNLDRGGREVALVANVPVLRVKRGMVDVSDTDFPEEIESGRTESSRMGLRHYNKNKRRR